MLARIEQRRNEFRHQNRLMKSEELGFQKIDEYDASRAPFRLHRVPNDAIQAQSVNYVLPTKTRVRRILHAN